MTCIARMPKPMTRPPISGASGKCRLPISKPARQERTPITSTAPAAIGSNPLASVGSSARIETKVDAHNAAPVPTEAMKSQPRRAAPSGARARAKWRMATPVPKKKTARAGKMAHADPGAEQADGARGHNEDLLIGKAIGRGVEHDILLSPQP